MNLLWDNFNYATHHMEMLELFYRSFTIQWNENLYTNSFYLFSSIKIISYVLTYFLYILLSFYRLF